MTPLFALIAGNAAAWRPRGASTVLHKLRRAGCWTVAVLAIASAGSPAIADEESGGNAPPPCLDEVVDVYLSPWQYGRGSAPGHVRPGPPTVHLRLPRRGLYVEPKVSAATQDCNQNAFAGWGAIYLRASTLARALDVPHDFPRLQDASISFRALDPDVRPSLSNALPLVDDADDREGMARKGFWTFIQSSASPLLGTFCLDQSSPKGKCYVLVGQVMSYRTASLGIISSAFRGATLGLPSNERMSQITVADVDDHFAFLRRIADRVLAAP